MSEAARVVVEIEWTKIGEVERAKVNVTGEHDGLQALAQKLVDLVLANRGGVFTETDP